jgi:hypothetical protein
MMQMHKKRKRNQRETKCWCHKCCGEDTTYWAVRRHASRRRCVPPDQLREGQLDEAVVTSQLADPDLDDRLANPDCAEEDPHFEDAQDDEELKELDVVWAQNMRVTMWGGELDHMGWPDDIVPNVLESVCLMQSVHAKHRGSMSSAKHQYTSTLMLLPPGHGMVSYGKAQAMLRQLSVHRVERIAGCVEGCMLRYDCKRVPDARFGDCVTCPICTRPLYTTAGKPRMVNYYMPLEHHVRDIWANKDVGPKYRVRQYQSATGSLIDSRGYNAKVLLDPKVVAEPRATVWQLLLDGVPINKYVNNRLFC